MRARRAVFSQAEQEFEPSITRGLRRANRDRVGPALLQPVLADQRGLSSDERERGSWSHAEQRGARCGALNRLDRGGELHRRRNAPTAEISESGLTLLASES